MQYLNTPKNKNPSKHKWVWGIEKANMDVENRVVLLNLYEIRPKTHPLLKLVKIHTLKNTRNTMIKGQWNNSTLNLENLYLKNITTYVQYTMKVCTTEKIELHHIKPVKEGGKYTVSNIKPLHQLCHISITHAKKKEMKR